MIARPANRLVVLGLLGAIAVGCSSTSEPGPGLRLTPSGDADTTEPLEDGGPASSDASTTTDARDASTQDAAEQGPEYSGEATYYDAEGVGACGIDTPPDYMVAAINDEQYSKANCGRCVSVKGPKGTIVVRVIDKCPGCAYGDLDLSQTAFTKIADKSAGRVPITWRFVACP